MIIKRPYPLFPLPRDYESLSAEGQRLARIATLSDISTPYKLVLAWDLFRRIYLGGSEKAVFYKNGFQESPEFHYEMVYDLGRYARNATAAPRGSAKSTVLMEVTMLLALVKKFYEIMYGLSTDRQVETRFDQMMMQFQDNELILADFGEIKPKRGTAIWNHHHLHLMNGSIITGLSVMGKKRGGRPRLFILDDPENDPDSESESSRIAVMEKFERILFKQIIPMLEAGSSIFWAGTLIDRRSSLYRAVASTDDPRFDFWNRKILKAIAYDKEDPSKCYVLWPEKWPRDVLEARKQEIGPSSFASEYCNEPISENERILRVDPRKNEYIVEGKFDASNPLVQTNKVTWFERIIGNGPVFYKEQSKPFNELVSPMFRILLFDYASGLKCYNDYSCIAVEGFDTMSSLWVLHLWLGRAKDDTLMRMIYEIGLAWRVRVIGIEAVSIQKSFAEAAIEYMAATADARGDLWRPRVFPVKYPDRESKGERISSALEWRFGSGRIKYPVQWKNEWPYDQLYIQTADFTKDLGLLPHDDVIDTVAMHKYVIRTKGRQYSKEKGSMSLLERIQKNQPDVRGMPLLSGVPTSAITDEMIDALSDLARPKPGNPKDRRLYRRKPNITY